MDGKYAGKTIVLPKDVTEKLLKVQVALEEDLGFKPSLSECVAHLIKLKLPNA